MDLASYVDTVSHSKLMVVLSRTIKDGRVLSLIHKYLNAGVMEDGRLILGQVLTNEILGKRSYPSMLSRLWQVMTTLLCLYMI